MLKVCTLGVSEQMGFHLLLPPIASQLALCPLCPARFSALGHPDPELQLFRPNLEAMSLLLLDYSSFLGLSSALPYLTVILLFGLFWLKLRIILKFSRKTSIFWKLVLSSPSKVIFNLLLVVYLYHSNHFSSFF